MIYKKNFKKWLDFQDLPSYLRSDLLSMDEKTKENAFYTNLEFGTAGMRGIIGAGINRINIYVVRQVTEGLACLIESKGADLKNRGVAIAYDSRHFSMEFAFECAIVLAKHHIKSYIFESLRPTPELSFAIRHLKTVAGIMITASHNPASFNGYKIYGEDGGQMSLKDSDVLTDYIRKIDNSFDIEVADFESEIASGLIEFIGEDIDIEYLKEVKSVNINQELIDVYGRDLKIVYTPLHGTGEMLVRRALSQSGFKSVRIVEAQATKDPNFSTVESPNPESPGSFILAEQLGHEVDADILVATDPDADRLGVEIRQADGSYRNLSGNQIGALIVKYILEFHRKYGTLPSNSAVVKSIVSTELVTKIAENYGVTVFNVLTGFRFIAEKIQEFEEKSNYVYLFGFEESFGYLVKPFVRDKDAIQALLLVVEIAAYYRSRGLTLLDGIHELYEEYGYFSEKTVSFTVSGIEGVSRIRRIMDKFRSSGLNQFAGVEIVKVEDFKYRTSTTDVGIEKLIVPSTNMIKYTLSDGSWIAVRPSGTEPKIKFYISTIGLNLIESENKISIIESEINNFI